MPKYHIITYGCQRNKNDSERIAAYLENKNYQSVSGPDNADLIVVNMCSVRQSAVDRVYGQFKNLQKFKAKKVLVGCILKKDKEKFKKIFDEIQDIKNYTGAQPRYKSSFRAYVPIMTGCNNFCTYCAVPYTRGREISRPADEIICEVKNLIKNDYKEIWLLGENVSSYQFNFPKLLKMINEIPGNFWIRFTSSHPKDFSDELIGAVAESEKITEYINLPAQSGDGAILKKMNRPYNIKNYKKLVRKIRQKIPGVCLSTDVIVGFPGETKKQFENTVKLFKEIKYDMAYIAQYSPRPGTAASKMKDDVPHQEKERRDKALTEVLKQTALENNKKYIGRAVEVLVDGQKKEFLTGKTKTYKTVKFEGPKNLIGQFSKVKITGVLPWGLKGKLLS